jgi:hypothetical protein
MDYFLPYTNPTVFLSQTILKEVHFLWRYTRINLLTTKTEIIKPNYKIVHINSMQITHHHKYITANVNNRKSWLIPKKDINF